MTEAERNTVIVAMNNRLLDGENRPRVEVARPWIFTA